jgi:FkbM family methyltransferase
VVVAVEPNPRNYELLLRNLSLNRLENVLTVRAAVMDNDGTTSFWIRDSSLGGSAINTSSERPIVVPCYRLDTLLRSLGIGSSLLMKLDVESAELTALSGAPESLNRCPLMIIEVDKINGNPVRSLLSSLGFNFLVLDEDSHHSNFLCRKVENT